MKTYRKDFSIMADSLMMGNNELEEVITNRQDKFSQTVGYKEVRGQFQVLLDKLVASFPEAKKLAGNIQDAANGLECSCYSAAYRDGVSDLMAAMTFNKSGITSVEYYVDPTEEASIADQFERSKFEGVA